MRPQRPLNVYRSISTDSSPSPRERRTYRPQTPHNFSYPRNHRGLASQLAIYDPLHNPRHQYDAPNPAHDDLYYEQRSHSHDLAVDIRDGPYAWDGGPNASEYQDESITTASRSALSHRTYKPPTFRAAPASNAFVAPTIQHKDPKPRGTHGIRLRPVSELRENIYRDTRVFSLLICVHFTGEADMYRTMFKFGVFNAVQSECFEMVSGKMCLVM